jgi:CubicO group peptidase (beta-lactamase class C family)
MDVDLAGVLTEHRVPGASVAVLTGDEVTAFAGGVLNTGTGAPATTESLFQIGSITKVCTATVLMRLIERGLVELDTPVAAVLPRFDRADRITVRHLLTHTSGIDGDFFHDTGRGADCLEKYTAACTELKQLHPPGASMSYCNTGFSLLGRIVEVLTGECWDDVLRELLLDPLGMDHSWTLAEDVLRFSAALGHEPGTDGVLRPAAVWGMPRSVGPAGTVNATATDVLALARLHLRGGLAPDGTRLLSERTVAAMREPQVEVPNAWGKGDRWGLGWALFDQAGIYGHDGGTIGQRACLRVVPDAGVAVAVLANSETAGPLITSLTDQLLRELAGVDPVPPITPPQDPVDPIDLHRYTGVYAREAIRFEAVVRDGGLVLRVSEVDELGSGPKDYEIALVPLPDGRFAGRHPLQTVWTPVRFLQDPAGLHVSGRLTPKLDGPA